MNAASLNKDLQRRRCCHASSAERSPQESNAVLSNGQQQQGSLPDLDVVALLESFAVLSLALGMVSRPKLHLPGKLRRKKALQSPEANTEQHPQASPFQTAAQPGSEPLGRIRVQVYGGQDLLASDSNGLSDPFVRISSGNTRIQSDIISKTLNPIWGSDWPEGIEAVPEAKSSSKPAVLDFQGYRDTLAQKVIEIVIWDKDRFSKNDYLGEVNLDLDAWFPWLVDNAVLFNNPDNRPRWCPVSSTRGKTEASGALLVKVGFLDTAQNISGEDELCDEVKEIMHEWDAHGRRSRTERILTAPPILSVGTIQKRDNPLSGDAMENMAYDYELPGGSSSGSEIDEDDDEEYDNASEASDMSERFTSAPLEPYDIDPSAYVSRPENLPDLVISDEPVSTESSADALEPQTAVQQSKQGRKLSFPLFKRTNSTRSTASTVGGGPEADAGLASTESVAASETGNTTGGGGGRKIPFIKKKTSRPSLGSTPSSPDQSLSVVEEPPTAKQQKRKRKGNKGKQYQFGSSDVVGVCFVEVQGASDLPRWKDATRLTFDMDPFVVISFGKKVFRTRVLRHTLNPKWDERLFFHVRSSETGYNVQFSVYDWDRVSSNDYVGSAATNIANYSSVAPQPDDNGLYACNDKGFLIGDQFQDQELHLEVPQLPDRERTKHPALKIRAKYVPYEALRQQFWRQYLQDFDADGNGEFSEVELFAMLDSLGSTLSDETLESFFARFDKSRDSGALSYDEVVACLESELSRAEHQVMPPPSVAPSGAATPATEVPTLGDNAEGLHVTGNHSAMPDRNQRLSPSSKPINPPYGSKDEVLTSSSSTDTSVNEETPAPQQLERVINIKECPLCHKPRLNKRSEVDIITHLAVCASQDWSHMGSLMVSNFVTSEQAHRKWFRRAISRVTKGAYSLGADSGNILVQNRMTGQLLEEKMQIYVRLGIRLGYRGMTGTVEGGRVRRLFASMSMKQGMKYDSPDSAEEIKPFIAFHKLDMSEVREPLSSFKTFNQFFYRKLKMDARPVTDPNDTRTLVSSSDCRFMAFQTIDDATRIWIKGKEFSVSRMLGDRYGQEAKKYEGGSLCIFRLAPQDYHRYHSPVDGKQGEFDKISGLYYTVNPMAIRSPIDVYGENKREVAPIDSPDFGRVMMVYVGAMLVAGIHQTVKEGDMVKRGDELGYFAFGGSTIVAVFEPGRVQFDQDILRNSDQAIETLVRVGMRIGRVPGSA